MEEWMRRVVACETEDDADRVFHDILMEDYLNESRMTPMSPKFAEDLLRKNIGYMAGYLDHKTADRIFRLFKTEHPIFGTEHPTLEQGIQAGIRMSWERGYAKHLTEAEVANMLKLTKDLKKWRNT